MKSLDDLKELYHRLEQKNGPAQPAHHGLSRGIYFTDPDGNGIEVYYEIPKDQWQRQDNLFMSGEMLKGQFPGPWDKQLAEKEAVAS